MKLFGKILYILSLLIFAGAALGFMYTAGHGFPDGIQSMLPLLLDAGVGLVIYYLSLKIRKSA